MNYLAALKRPTLVINETICRRNIARMVDMAAGKDLLLRPHFKTHNSVVVGKWFRESGISAITVSSITMTTLFAEDDWNDITIAFPLNLRELEDINLLAERINLNLLIESETSINKLVEEMEFPVGFFIKVDTGYHRTGLAPDNYRLINSILKESEHNPLLSFKGFLTHAGHTYKARGKKEILEIHHRSIKIMEGLKLKYSENYPGLIISTGDTPSCSVADNFTGVDELRPGNFVYYDLMQERIGSCDYKDIGVAVACPVVAKHDDRQEIVIYGGTVHLSKEQLLDDEGKVIYGRIAEPADRGWTDPIDNVWVTALSQEHGIISSCNPEFFRRTNIGDILMILPVHSCLAANLLEDQIIV